MYRSIAALTERLNNGANSRSFSSHSVRHLVRHADTNGLAPHVTRLGRKILIDEDGFNSWLDSHNSTNKAA